MKNESFWDRSIRLILAVVLGELALFWLGGLWAMAVYGLAAALVVTAVIGFCPFYKFLGLDTFKNKLGAASKVGRVTTIVLGLVVLVGGSYASDFFTRKSFLEDFNAMNNFYKQTLFNTGQNNRDKSVENYKRLITEYASFEAKYIAYQPYALKGDAQFNADLQQVDSLIVAVHDQIYSGDLHQAHLTLEQVRPIFQDVFKRNNFSMLSIALVDFHDAMELILTAADEKNPQKVIDLYPQVDEKLQAVEQAANDAEIQAIRQNLDAVLTLAQSSQLEALPDQAAALKSSFVKVYLKRG